jgi:exosortase
LVKALVVRQHLGLALLVAACASLLLWERRKSILSARSSSSNLGWVVLAFSLLSYFVGLRAALVVPNSITGVLVRWLSAVSFLLGSGLLLFGRECMRPVWLPCVLLIFVVPQDALLSSWFPLRLQTLATALSQATTRLLGMDVVREGHQLHTETFSANVEEACSGIRAITAIIPASLYLAETRLRQWGTRVMLVLLSLPIAVLANSARITLTLVLATHVSPKLARGFFHGFTGLGLFALALGALVLALVLLRSAEQGGCGRSREALAGGWDSATGGLMPIRPGQKALAICAVQAVFLAVAGSQLFARQSSAGGGGGADSPLAALPSQVGPWLAEYLDVPPYVHRVRTPSDAACLRFTAPGRPPATAYVLYWAPRLPPGMRTLQHSFEVCAPFKGLRQRWREETVLDIAQVPGGKVKARTTGFAAPGEAIVVTSCEFVGLTALDPTQAGRAPSGALRKLAHGLRLLRLGPTPDRPSFAFQFTSPGSYRKEEILLAHREVAGELIAHVLKAGIPADG